MAVIFPPYAEGGGGTPGPPGDSVEVTYVPDSEWASLPADPDPLHVYVRVPDA